MKGIKRLLRSSKFWLAVAAAGVPVVNQVTGLALAVPEVVAIVAAIIAAIAGTAYEDAAAKAAGAKVPPVEDKPE